MDSGRDTALLMSLVAILNDNKDRPKSVLDNFAQKPKFGDQRKMKRADTMK